MMIGRSRGGRGSGHLVVGTEGRAVIPIWKPAFTTLLFSLILGTVAVRGGEPKGGKIETLGPGLTALRLPIDDLVTTKPFTTAATFTPDGQTLLTASVDQRSIIRAWSATTGKLLREWPADVTGMGKLAAVSTPNAPLLVVSVNSTGFTLWDGQAGQPLRRLPWRNGSSGALQFSRDGR